MPRGRGQRLWTSGSSQQAARHWEIGDKHTKSSRSACTQLSGGECLGKVAYMVTLCFALSLTEMQPVRGWALTPAVLGAGLVSPSELNTMDQQNAWYQSLVETSLPSPASELVAGLGFRQEHP